MTDAGTQAESGLPDAVTVAAVQEALIEWYEADHREYPWRGTDDPYEILVSEIMSQQTQLDRVVEAWSDFLDEWPTADALAEAPRGDVVAFWSDHSLGYNNRAKYLHEAATQVVDDYDGAFPETPEELQELMGVGPYTANAVASFAFNNGDAVVDTNVKRVLFAHLRKSIIRTTRTTSPSQTHLCRTESPEFGTTRSWNSAALPVGRNHGATRPVARGANGVTPTRLVTSPHPTFRHNRASKAVDGSSAGVWFDSSASTTRWSLIPWVIGFVSTTHRTVSTVESGFEVFFQIFPTTVSSRQKSRTIR